MTEIPLHGGECASCGRPAGRLVIRERARYVDHGAWKCVLPNPPTPVLNPIGVKE